MTDIVDPALQSIEGAVLPSLARLLDAAIEETALARPGVDAGSRAHRLARIAGDLAKLSRLLATCAPAPVSLQPPRRMSA